MIERFFDPKEANRQLPTLKKIVGEIIEMAHDSRLLLATPASFERESQLIELDSKIRALMAQIEEIGCYYKDWNFEIGLIDFPAIIHGQHTLLCWRSDEPQVEWFHGFEDGFAGRRPITKELVFS
jgi:hypothetical protein